MPRAIPISEKAKALANEHLDLLRHIARCIDRHNGGSVLGEVWLESVRRLNRYDASRGTVATYLNIPLIRMAIFRRELSKSQQALRERTVRLHDGIRAMPEHRDDDLREFLLVDLSPRLRSIISRHYFEAMDVPEIAEVEHTTTNRISELITYACRQIRERLRDQRIQLMEAA